MITRRASLLFPLSWGLAGCTLSGEMTVSGPAASPLIKLWHDGWFGPEPVALERLDVLVIEPLPAPARQTMWAIQSTGRDRCDSHAFDIHYGLAPQGFRELTPAAPLREGQMYELAPYSCGYNLDAAFKIEGGQAVMLTSQERYEASRGPQPPYVSDKPPQPDKPR